MSEETYWLWLDEQQSGPFDLREINELAVDGNEDEPPPVNRETLFWSETLNDWRPLWDLPNEWDRKRGRNRGAELQGFTIQYSATGTARDCDTCQRMNGQRFNLPEVPPLPLRGCTCQPYSGGLWIAAELR